MFRDRFLCLEKADVSVKNNLLQLFSLLSFIWL